MTTTVNKVSNLPTPPSISDPENFNERADEFFNALPGFVSQFNGAVDLINEGISEAYESAQNSTASATAAASASSASLWVSSTAYTQGQVVYSPITYQTYRRKSLNSGTAYSVDPSLDISRWATLTNGDVNLITDNSVSTLNNKTLVNPLLKGQKETFLTVSASSTIVLDTSVYSVFKVTLTTNTNITLSAAHLLQDEVATCILEINNPNNYLVTWGGGSVSVKWPYGLAPQLTSSGTDIFGFMTYTQGTIWIGNTIALGVQ